MSIYLTQTSRSAFFLCVLFLGKAGKTTTPVVCCQVGLVDHHYTLQEKWKGSCKITHKLTMRNERKREGCGAVVVAREASALHKNVQIHDSSCILRDFKLLSLLSLWNFVNLLSIKISPLRRRFSHELAIKFVGLSLSGENLSRVHIFQLMKRNATDLERSGEKRSCGNYWIYHFTLSHESNASLFPCSSTGTAREGSRK